MNHVIYHAITNVSDDLVDEAITTKLRKPIRWQPYTALAACLALVIAIGSHLPLNMGSDSSSSSSSSSITTTTTESAPAPDSAVEESVLEDTTAGVVHTADQLETVTVTLVSWQDDGFCATVETGNDLFPEGAELTVVCEATETWDAGTMVTVSFTEYEEYEAANGFDNRVYADGVAVK